MKRMEYILALLFVFLGIACLTMSGSILFDLNLKVLIRTFLLICVMIGIPIIITGLIYFWTERKRNRGN